MAHQREMECFVPNCKNNSTNAPDKLFVLIREDLKPDWCRQVNSQYFRDYCMYCCEDHLNLEEDLRNYNKWKIMGEEPKLKPTAKLRNIKNQESGPVKQKVKIKKATHKTGQKMSATSNDSELMKLPPNNVMQCNKKRQLDANVISSLSAFSSHTVKEMEDNKEVENRMYQRVAQPDVCRCCLSARGVWDLTAARAGHDVYGEKLTECYGITLSLLSEDEASHVICESCTTQLNLAYRFRHQVLAANEKFVKYWRRRFKLPVKEEPDVSDFNFIDETKMDVQNELVVPVKKKQKTNYNVINIRTDLHYHKESLPEIIPIKSETITMEIEETDTTHNQETVKKEKEDKVNIDLDLQCYSESSEIIDTNISETVNENIEGKNPDLLSESCEVEIIDGKGDSVVEIIDEKSESVVEIIDQTSKTEHGAIEWTYSDCFPQSPLAETVETEPVKDMKKRVLNYSLQSSLSYCNLDSHYQENNLKRQRKKRKSGADKKDPSPEEEVNKQNWSKHCTNLQEIIACSNATPVYRFFDNTVTCYYCEDKFNQLPALKNHTLEKHSYSERRELHFENEELKTVELDITSLACKLCDEKVFSIKQLLNHLSEIHDKTVYCDAGVLEFIVSLQYINDALFCVACAKGFQQQTDLIQHLTKRHQFHPFKCRHCQKRYPTEEKRKTHEKYEHINTYIMCSICKQMIHKNLRYRHRKTVHGITVKIPKVECDICNKKFTKNALTCHMAAMHSSNSRKLYNCPEPGCDKVYLKSNGIKNHMWVHTGIKTYECNDCGLHTSTRGALVLHMKIHMNDRQYTCEVCGHNCVQKITLKSHMWSKHKMKM